MGIDRDTMIGHGFRAMAWAISLQTAGVREHTGLPTHHTSTEKRSSFPIP